MKNLLIFLPYVILTVFIFLFVSQCEQNKVLRHQIQGLEGKVPDTTYVDRPIKVPGPLEIREIPREVIKYVDRTIQVDSIVYRDSLRVITVYVPEESPINYSDKFLTNFPEAPKLLFADFNHKQVALGLLTPTGNSLEQRYSLNFNRYEYRYVEGNLYSNQRNFFQRLKFVGEYQIRPFNNFHDLNLGIKHNTGFIKTEIGINGHYYKLPNYKFGYGPYLKLQIEL